MKKNVESIPINMIHVNPHQPRLQFDDDNIGELAESIMANGLIQPIIVREVDDGYELVAGERRLRAVSSLNLPSINAIIENYDDHTSAKIAIIENIQRENLSPIEEAIAFEKLIKDHDYTQAELASSLGKSQSTIANKIRLLGLSEKVKNNLLERKITERHGRALLKISDHVQQERVLDKILETRLNVAQTEKYIETYINPKNKPIKKRIISKLDYRLELNTLKQSIEVIKRSGVNVSYDIEESEEGVKVEIFMSK